MKRITLTAFSILFLLTLSCKKETKKTNEPINQPKEVLNYVIDPSVTTVEWTAYKTTEKTPVKGKFLRLDIENPIKSTSKQGALEGVKFSIPTSSFFSANEERDNKIKTLFWDIMDNTKMVTGSFTNVSGNDIEGNVNLAVTMNNETVSIPMNYKIDGNKIALNGTITNLLDWKMEKAFNSLHKACELLHTGTDGVSKTWQEVEINAVAILKTK